MQRKLGLLKQVIKEMEGEEDSEILEELKKVSLQLCDNISEMGKYAKDRQTWKPNTPLKFTTEMIDEELKDL